MSLRSLEKFKKYLQEKNLVEDLKCDHKRLKNSDFLNQLINLAKQEGYEFTEEDLEQYGKISENKVELSDVNLENVAGGKSGKLFVMLGIISLLGIGGGLSVSAAGDGSSSSTSGSKVSEPSKYSGPESETDGEEQEVDKNKGPVKESVDSSKSESVVADEKQEVDKNGDAVKESVDNLRPESDKSLKPESAVAIEGNVSVDDLEERMKADKACLRALLISDNFIQCLRVRQPFERSSQKREIIDGLLGLKDKWEEENLEKIREKLKSMGKGEGLVRAVLSLLNIDIERLGINISQEWLNAPMENRTIKGKECRLVEMVIQEEIFEDRIISPTVSKKSVFHTYFCDKNLLWKEVGKEKNADVLSFKSLVNKGKVIFLRYEEKNLRDYLTFYPISRSERSERKCVFGRDIEVVEHMDLKKNLVVPPNPVAYYEAPQDVILKNKTELLEKYYGEIAKVKEDDKRVVKNYIKRVFFEDEVLKNIVENTNCYYLKPFKSDLGIYRIRKLNDAIKIYNFIANDEDLEKRDDGGKALRMVLYVIKDNINKIERAKNKTSAEEKLRELNVTELKFKVEDILNVLHEVGSLEKKGCLRYGNALWALPYAASDQGEMCDFIRAKVKDREKLVGICERTLEILENNPVPDVKSLPRDLIIDECQQSPPEGDVFAERFSVRFLGNYARIISEPIMNFMIDDNFDIRGSLVDEFVESYLRIKNGGMHPNDSLIVSCILGVQKRIQEVKQIAEGFGVDLSKGGARKYILETLSRINESLFTKIDSAIKSAGSDSEKRFIEETQNLLNDFEKKRTVILQGQEHRLRLVAEENYGGLIDDARRLWSFNEMLEIGRLTDKAAEDFVRNRVIRVEGEMGRNLSFLVRRIFNDYTNSSSALNEKLLDKAKGNATFEDADKNKIKVMDAIFNSEVSDGVRALKSKLSTESTTSNIVVYRLDTYANDSVGICQYKVGDISHRIAYMSTSTSAFFVQGHVPRQSDRPYHVCTIVIGQMGIPVIGSYSTHRTILPILAGRTDPGATMEKYVGQAEVLFPRDSYYKVLAMQAGNPGDACDRYVVLQECEGKGTSAETDHRNF